MKDRENNTRYNNTTNTSNLDFVSCAYSAHDEQEITSSKSTTSLPLAGTRGAVVSLEKKGNRAPISNGEVVLIGVSLRQPQKHKPDRRAFGISVTWDTGVNEQLSCDMAHYERKRELKGTISDSSAKQWPGYDCALDFMQSFDKSVKQDSYCGKLRHSSKWKNGVPQKLPIIPKTAAVHWIDNTGAYVRLWLGEQVFDIELNANISGKQKQFYVATGYWKPAGDVLGEDMF